jgi:hypothetical protein
MNCWGCGACTALGSVPDAEGGVDWPDSCAFTLIVSALASSIAVVNRQTDLKADKDIRVSPCIRAARNDDKAFPIQVLLRKTPCLGFIFVLPVMFCGQGAAFRVKLPSGIQQYS